MVPSLPNRVPWHGFWIYVFGTLLTVIGLSIMTGIDDKHRIIHPNYADIRPVIPVGEVTVSR